MDRFFVKVANTVMIFTLAQLQRSTDWWLSAALADRVTWLAVSVVAGAGAYFLVLVVMGMRPAQFRLRHD